MLEEQGHLFNWTSLCASNWQATWVILPGGNNPENLQRKAPWRHPNQMPKHYYYTTTLLWAPSGRPSSLPHLSLILAGLSTVSFFRLLMTIGEGWNTDRLVHRKLCLLAQLPPHHSCPVQCPHYWWCRTKPPVSSWLLQARLQTAPVHTDHWLYMVWWSQQNHVTCKSEIPKLDTHLSLAAGWDPVHDYHKHNLRQGATLVDRVQHRPKTCLTLCWEYGPSSLTLVI